VFPLRKLYTEQKCVLLHTMRKQLHNHCRHTNSNVFLMLKGLCNIYIYIYIYCIYMPY